MSNIQIQIEKNIKLLKEIETIAQKVAIVSEKRDLLFTGFFRNTLSHYYSIVILCEKQLYNSAFSMIRVFFESAIRAEYLYKIISEEKINKLYDGVGWNNAFPTVREICEEIDAEYNTDFYTEIKNTAYKAMNDYTHTGYQQVSRNFDEVKGTIGANFSEDIIVDSLKGTSVVAYILAIGYFEQIGLSSGTITETDIKKFKINSPISKQ